jgi:hypothetical protein
MYDFEFLFDKIKFSTRYLKAIIIVFTNNIFRFRFNKWMKKFMGLNYGVKLWDIMRIFLKIEMHTGMN